MENPRNCKSDGCASTNNERHKNNSSFPQWIHVADGVVQGTTILTAVELVQVLSLTEQFNFLVRERLNFLLAIVTKRGKIKSKAGNTLSNN
ncbi:hypothetical protein H6G94_36105 [Nostoc punctiforme FACHB-252]|uniref:Uncharacterized protein n=1 Tax=Nostoc punctiforme FACHB-252 TaxID=1357509 RepID=A0ABR8HMW4_NOSPU|nr:hypothetical protein [Nostoc punctiforme]MBD2616581.1 hypothetical protein [Nostoc punctiforme FACHB-252]